MNLKYSENKGMIAVVILSMVLVAFDRMNLGGAVIVTAYWGCIKIFSWSKKSSLRLQVTPILIIASVALLAHKIPGFHNILFYNF